MNSEIRSRWLVELLSTAPADRRRTEGAVRRLYSAAGFEAPDYFIWFDSPFAASWAVALLVAPSQQLWSQRLAAKSLSPSDRQRIEDARTVIVDTIGGSGSRR